MVRILLQFSRLNTKTHYCTLHGVLMIFASSPKSSFSAPTAQSFYYCLQQLTTASYAVEGSVNLITVQIREDMAQDSQHRSLQAIRLFLEPPARVCSAPRLLVRPCPSFLSGSLTNLDHEFSRGAIIACEASAFTSGTRFRRPSSHPRWERLQHSSNARYAMAGEFLNMLP